MLGNIQTYERNLPTTPYTIDAARFAAMTNRFRKSYAPLAWPGFGSKVSQVIDRYGIIGKLHIFFEGTLTGDGTAAPTATSGFPWRLLSEVRVSANGISQLIDVDGLDLRALARARRGKSLTDESTFTLPTTSGTSTLRLHWEVPLALDDVSLIGAVLAQTDDNNLSIRLTTADSADLFSAHAPTFSSANFYILAEAYEIPEATVNGQTNLIIPDLRQMHGLFTRDDDLVSTGQNVTPLTKTGGILLRTLQRIDNAPPNFGNADWLEDTVSIHAFRFNSKEIPYEYEPAWMLRFLNDGDYSQATLPSADVPSGVTAPAYVVDDYVAQVAARDVVNMAAVSQPEMLNTIASGYSLNSGAKIHTVQEAMVTG
jgi:hypothetical protein